MLSLVFGPSKVLVYFQSPVHMHVPPPKGCKLEAEVQSNFREFSGEHAMTVFVLFLQCFIYSFSSLSPNMIILLGSDILVYPWFSPLNAVTWFVCSNYVKSNQVLWRRNMLPNEIFIFPCRMSFYFPNTSPKNLFHIIIQLLWENYSWIKVLS